MIKLILEGFTSELEKIAVINPIGKIKSLRTEEDRIEKIKTKDLPDSVTTSDDPIKFTAFQQAV